MVASKVFGINQIDPQGSFTGRQAGRTPGRGTLTMTLVTGLRPGADPTCVRSLVAENKISHDGDDVNDRTADHNFRLARQSSPAHG